MTLAMARPWKHPKTGVYWLRRRVPADLRPLVGKLEILRSLGTKDPAEAKLKHAEALLAVKMQWVNLRAGPKTLSEREAHELAAPVHDGWVAEHRENPSEQRFWPTELFEKLWDLVRTGPVGAASSVQGSVATTRLELWCQKQADALLAKKGLVADEFGRTRVAKAVAAAIQRASLKLRALDGGQELTPAMSPVVARSSRLAPSLPDAAREPVGFDELLAGWAKEKQAAE